MNDVGAHVPAPSVTPGDAMADIGFATDHTGLRVMGFSECLRRLGGVAVGRLAFALDGEIAVLPVNHVLDGVDVCFRTSGGSKIQAAVDGDAVSYQVDEWDLAGRSGWSVLVQGTASIVTDEAALARLASTARRPWVPMDLATARWVKVSTRQVTGRMILPQ